MIALPITATISPPAASSGHFAVALFVPALVVRHGSREADQGGDFPTARSHL